MNLPKDAIVFNHIQSKSLLENGYAIGHGQSMASGSAYAHGNAYKGGKKGKKRLKKFKNWFETLFDWMEVRLEKHTKKLERIEKKADANIDRGRYGSAAKNYRQLISGSISAINMNRTAAGKYQSQANAVLNQAVSRKLITKKQAASIRKGVANGSLNISKYGEKMREVIKDYQEFADKAQDAKDAIADLHDKMRDYIDDLKDMREAQRDAKVDRAETLSGIASGGLTSESRPIFAGTQLAAKNAYLVQERNAYKSNVDNLQKDFNASQKSATKNANKAVNGAIKKAKGAYKKALKKAQSCVKSNKKIPNGTLNVIKKNNQKVYTRLVAYNETISLRSQEEKIIQEARLEAAEKYAETSAEIYQNKLDITSLKNDRLDRNIDLFRKQADATDTAEGKNSLLDQAASAYGSIATNSRKNEQSLRKSVDKFGGTISNSAGTTKALTKLGKKNKTRKAVENAIKTAKNHVKKGEAINASTLSKLADYYSKGYITYGFYTSCVNYNNAINAWTEAKYQAEIDEATAKVEKSAIAKEKLDNASAQYEQQRGINSATMSNISAQIENKKKTGQKVTRKDYAGLISQAKSDEQVAYNAYIAYKSYYDKVKNDLTAEDKSAALQRIQELEQGWYDAKNAVLDYESEAIQVEIDNAQNKMDLLKAQSELLSNIKAKNDNINDQIKASNDYYDLMIEQETDLTKKAILRAEKEKAVRDLLAEQLENIKNQNSYMTGWYTSQGDVNEAENDALRVAKGTDTNSSRWQVAMFNKSVQEGVARENRASAQQLYNSLHTSQYGTWKNGQFVVWSNMYEQYMKGMADYRGMLADAYKAEAEAAQSSYDAWEVWYLTPKKEALDAYEHQADMINANIDLRSAKGWSTTASNYQSLINNSSQQIANLQSQNATIRAQMALYDMQSEKYKDLKKLLEDNDKAIIDAQKDQVEWNNAIAQIPYDNLEKALDRLDAIENYYQSILDLNEQLGKDSSKADYNNVIAQNQAKLTQAQSQMNQAYADWQKAKSNGGVYGGKTSAEWETEYYKYRADVNSISESIDKIKDDMRDDIYWRTFERAHDSAERLKDSLSGISDLIDDEMFFDKDGRLTKYGITQIGLLAKQYENARKEVSNYSDDIKNLNSLYNQGMYTSEEYKEKLADLQSKLLDSAGDMKSYIMEIRDMYKDIDQSELDGLNKLIEKRKKALSAKKSYYDYDKSVRSQLKEINELEAQIAALSGVNTDNAKSQMAKLQESLQDAKDELEDTRKQHEFDLSSEALDGMQEVLQDEFDEKWEKLGLDLEGIQDLLASANSIVSSNTASINKTLDTLLTFYGVSGGTSIPHFASGTRRVSGSLVGLSNEAGSELIVTKNGIISHFNPGDGVVPSALTQRLYAMASGSAAIPISGGGSTEIHQHYDSLITIEGSADAATVEDLKRFSKEFLEKSYDYTTQRIKQDYVRTGGSRRV